MYYLLSNPLAKLLIHYRDIPQSDRRLDSKRFLRIFIAAAPKSVNVGKLLVSQNVHNRFAFTADAVIQRDLKVSMVQVGVQRLPKRLKLIPSGAY